MGNTIPDSSHHKIDVAGGAGIGLFAARNYAKGKGLTNTKGESLVVYTGEHMGLGQPNCQQLMRLRGRVSTRLCEETMDRKQETA